MRGGRRVREKYKYTKTRRTRTRKNKKGKTVRRTRRTKNIRSRKRRTAKQRWRVKRTNNPQTWWSYRLKINRWRFSRRMSRTQGYWYLRRYSDLRKKFGARNWRAAQKHWREYGIRERRNKLAYKDLNEWEAKSYYEHFKDVKWTSSMKMTSI